MKNAAIRYAVRPSDLTAHRFEIECTIAQPDPGEMRVSLPAWIPGSYLIRDFARHIVGFSATTGGRPAATEKCDKQTWRITGTQPDRPLVITCEVYAWDLSVRGAYLDETRGFFNGSSVFLQVHGREDAPCLVSLQPPAGQPDTAWRVATALEPARGLAGCAKRHGFGLYRAENYDELIDHPVEMGSFSLARFTACGVPHEIALSGRHDCDLDRLCADLKKVCEWQIRFFGEPAPMKRYLFLITAVGEGYGGLEHRASTALICARGDLPYRGMPPMTDGYRSLLGLCSHEYFHTWNVKRIRPQAFTPYRLDRENYTTLLWAFEGITSYYDDLALLRSGVITLDDWRELIAKTLTTVRRTPGRLQQSIAESSFDAWIKFYRPDENTPNAVVSYYAKGSLVALALDLTLRAKTAGRRSLDDIMKALWTDYGQRGIGVGERDIERLAEAISDLNLQRFFAKYVRGTDELPLERLLAPFGIKLVWNGSATPSFGAKTAADPGGLRLSTVYTGGAAERAGLAAGDLVVAIDGLRTSADTLERQLSRRMPGATVEVHAFRRDELIVRHVRLDPAQKDSARLEIAAPAGRKSDEQMETLRRSWLGR